jgi:hypothetical protein
MPGHSLNLQRNLCLACGLTSLQIARAGTMACSGVPLAQPGRVPVAALDPGGHQRELLKDPPRETEAEFQTSVEMLADLHGWLHYHTRDSRGSNPGFLDLVLAHERARRLVIAELKVEPNTPTKHQRRWLETLQGMAGRLMIGEVEVATPPRFEVYLWYPRDWPEVVKTLTV